MSIAAITALGASVPAVAATPPATDDADVAVTAKTSPAEADRVDSVDVADLTWGPCWFAPKAAETADDKPKPTFSCAQLDVPLDYDDPDAGSYTLDISRREANTPDKKIGSLFTNPGGPGGAGMMYVAAAHVVFSDDVLNSFDIIGIEPRGVNGTQKAACYDSHDEAMEKSDDLATPPRTAEARKEYTELVRKNAEACARPENTVAGHVSTANVARDMDVVRRALGDDKLSYFGTSYGTILGQHYANMFPDRFRALAIDGVIDATNWAGRGWLGSQNHMHRTRSHAGSERALNELLRRCDTVGAEKCALAKADKDSGSAQKRFMAVLEELKANPIDVDITKIYPESDGDRPEKWEDYPEDLKFDEFHLANASNMALRKNSITPEQLMELAQVLETITTVRADKDLNPDELLAEKTAEFKKVVDLTLPYMTFKYPEKLFSADALQMVWCADGRHPTLDRSLDQALNARRYPVFGAQWGMAAVQCASDVWKIKDHGVYDGPFYKNTEVAPLVVGNKWDPATNHDQAVQLFLRTPNARLLSTDSWGHSSILTSKCAKDAINEYLMTGDAPRYSRCDGEYQPFEEDAEADVMPESIEDVARWLPLIGVSPTR